EREGATRADRSLPRRGAAVQGAVVVAFARPVLAEVGEGGLAKLVEEARRLGREGRGGRIRRRLGHGRTSLKNGQGKKKARNGKGVEKLLDSAVPAWFVGWR